jgi:hypothetical protein
MQEVLEHTVSDVTLGELHGVSPLLFEALRSKARGKPDYHAFFREEEHSIPVNSTKAKLRCHILASDGNGRPRVAGLAQKLRKQMLDYAIPRSQIAAAFTEFQTTKSTEAIVALEAKARSLFTDISNSGEGGEILLYYLAERVLEIPQVLCKMPLKTSAQMHYHGVDGVHAAVCEATGHLALYWGESKLHQKMAGAITACFDSIAPFLLGPESQNAAAQRDLQLLRDNLDLNDPKLEAALKLFLDPDNPLYQKTEFRAICLVGFDYANYTQIIHGQQPTFTQEAMEVFAECATRIQAAISKNNIDTFVIETFCIPFPSVEDFRNEFSKTMGA